MAQKKLAIFAEGGTEQYFVEKLIRTITNEKRIRIEKTKMRGGSCAPRQGRRIEIDAESDTQKYFVMIVDCGNDERVQSDIRDRYENLCAQNFDAIIGIRDVYPKGAADIPKIRQYLYYKIPTNPIRPKIVLTVMEVEAWFLAEHTHFPKIDASLTLHVVKATLAFDPEKDDVETRPHPTGDLDLVYQVAGKNYDKTPETIQRTIVALDCERIYLELADRIPSLGELVESVNSFFN